LLQLLQLKAEFEFSR